jgi:WD40 repeat protein
MTDDDLIISLVRRWQEGYERGEEVTPAELCRDRPELADELTRRVRQLRRLLEREGRPTAVTSAPNGHTRFDSAGQSHKPAPAAEPAGGDTPRPTQPPGYEIRGELGRGGMGVVYKARQTILNRTVALKMVVAGAHAEPESLVRFVAEAEAVAALQHPNVVQVYEVGSHEGLPFFSLEYCPGGSLTDRLAVTPLPPLSAAELVESLARAMQAAHDQGIVHRDLKPANVLFDAAGRPKIADFGLAKRLEAGCRLTRSGALIGTPSYMAPEQADGWAGVGPSADVYSLGAVLYECLTGRPPFEGPTVLDTLDQVLKRDPVPPAQLQPGVPRDLETVCLKCLQKDLRKRYPSAEALADDLRRFLDRRPIQARPVGRVGRLVRWARRNPAVAGLLAAVFASLAGGALAASVFAVNARTSAEQAEKARQRAEGERAEADAARGQARRAAEDAHDRLVRLYVATGSGAVEAGDLWTGLLWYARAWEADRPDRHPEAGHRTRLAGLTHRLPWLAGACFHTAPVLDADLSPDGRLVLTRTTEPQAYLWDPLTSEPAAPPLRHDGPVLHAAFAPGAEQVVTCGADRTARLWGIDGRPPRHTLTHPAAVRFAAFRPDGARLATACADGTVRLWDPATGQSAGPDVACGGTPSFLAFSPDGARLLTADDEDHARAWDAATSRPLTPPVPHQRYERRIPGEVLALSVEPAFSPDGRSFVTYSEGVRVWATDGGAERKRLSKESGLAKHVSFTPDGKAVLSLVLTTAYLRDVESGAVLFERTHPREALVGRISPDGRRIAVASSSGLVHLRDAKTGEAVVAPFQHVGEVSQLRFSADGQTLLVSSTDGTARLWRFEADPSAARPLAAGDPDAGRLPLAQRIDGRLVMVSPDGRREVRYGTDAPPQVFERAGGRAGPALEHGGKVVVARFSPDGSRLLTATASDARVWDAGTGRPVGPRLTLTEGVSQGVFSADGRRLLVVEKTLFRVCDVDGGRELIPPTRQRLETDVGSGPIVTDYAGRLGTCDLSPDGSRAVIAGGAYGLVRVYEVDTGRTLSPPLHDGHVPSARFAPDGRRVLTGSSDTTARVWDAATGSPVGPPLRHPKFVRDAAFSPDGQRVVTYASDATVRVWEAATGDLLLPPLKHPQNEPWGRVWFGGDGRRVFALSAWEKRLAVSWDVRELSPSKELVPAWVRLLSGREIDATDGIVLLKDADVRRDAETYRRAYQVARE